MLENRLAAENKQAWAGLSSDKKPHEPSREKEGSVLNQSASRVSRPEERIVTLRSYNDEHGITPKETYGKLSTVDLEAVSPFLRATG